MFQGGKGDLVEALFRRVFSTNWFNNTHKTRQKEAWDCKKYWIFSHPPYFSILLKASSAMIIRSCMPCTVVQAFGVKQPPKCRSVEYKRGRKPLQYLQVMVMSATTLTTFCIDICQSQLNPTSIRPRDSYQSRISKPF